MNLETTLKHIITLNITEVASRVTITAKTMLNYWKITLSYVEHIKYHNLNYEFMWFWITLAASLNSKCRILMTTNYVIV